MIHKPLLSVIVTITDGAANLGRCLHALHNQENMPATEIIVPVHPALDDVESLRKAYPAVRFIVVDNLPFSRKPSSHGLRHIIYDLRRASGLLAAQGEIIAMTEDHAIPPPGWCSQMLGLHADLPHAAIGGAINHAGMTLLSWAAYFCEFIRYQNPVLEGPAAYVSDINVSYKRTALDKVRPIWSRHYHETSVHAALRANGETLWLSPEPFIRHDRGKLTLAEMCRERIGWARIFAGRRAQAAGPLRRLLFALGTPLLPVLFLIRRWANVLRTKRSALPLLATTPALIILFCFWAYGEFLGYLTARDTRDDDPSLSDKTPFSGIVESEKTA